MPMVVVLFKIYDEDFRCSQYAVVIGFEKPIVL